MAFFYFVYRQNSTLQRVDETNTSRHFACGSCSGQLHDKMAHVRWPLPCRHDTTPCCHFPQMFQCSLVVDASVLSRRDTSHTAWIQSTIAKKMSSTATSCRKSLSSIHKKNLQSTTLCTVINEQTGIQAGTR